MVTRNSLRRLDFPGAILSLGGSSLLIFALEEGGGKREWNDTLIISSLAASGACWLLFAAWEYLLTFKSYVVFMLPLFPATLLSSRVISATIM
jgi:hypothetical protein